MHSLLDWLALIALLLVLQGAAVVIAIILLKNAVARQFREHDADLRSEVTKVNVGITHLIAEIKSRNTGW